MLIETKNKWKILSPASSSFATVELAPQFSRNRFQVHKIAETTSSALTKQIEGEMQINQFCQQFEILTRMSNRRNKEKPKIEVLGRNGKLA